MEPVSDVAWKDGHEYLQLYHAVKAYKIVPASRRNPLTFLSKRLTCPLPGFEMDVRFEKSLPFRRPDSALRLCLTNFLPEICVSNSPSVTCISSSRLTLADDLDHLTSSQTQIFRDWVSSLDSR